MDEYQRRARLYPALLAILPASIFAAMIVETPPAWWKAVSGVAVSAGGLYFMTHIGRTFGRRRQEELFRSWGGAPTTALMRFRGSDTPEKIVWLHREVTIATGKRLPTTEEEMRDPASADAIYEAAIARLRELRRDKKLYPLIFAENASFGFRRNLFGLRRVGIVVAVAVALACATLLVLSVTGHRPATHSGLIFALAAALGALVLWIWLVTPKWVQEAAEAYAERLLLSAGHQTTGLRKDQGS